jgi:hypothetical protein
VLGLPGRVARDQNDAPERPSLDPGDVVLDPAILAPGAGEVELLGIAIQLADGDDDVPDGLRPWMVPSSMEPSTMTSSARLSSQAG